MQRKVIVRMAKSISTNDIIGLVMENLALVIRVLLAGFGLGLVVEQAPAEPKYRRTLVALPTHAIATHRSRPDQ